MHPHFSAGENRAFIIEPLRTIEDKPQKKTKIKRKERTKTGKNEREREREGIKSERLKRHSGEQSSRSWAARSAVDPGQIN